MQPHKIRKLSSGAVAEEEIPLALRCTCIHVSRQRVAGRTEKSDCALGAFVFEAFKEEEF